jgi:predicted MFS family arabinose efflux permease
MKLFRSGYLQEVYGGLQKEIWILAITLFINRCGSMVLLFLSVYLTHVRKLTIPEAGIVISLYGLGSMAGAFIGGKVVDRKGPYAVLILSLLLTGFSIIALGYARSFLTISCLAFLVPALADSFRPANSASIARYARAEDYTRSIALMRLAMNLGFFISPILGGYLAVKNYSLLFWADGLTSIAAALFLWRILPKPKPKTMEVKVATEVKKANPYNDKNYLIFLLLVTVYATIFFQFFTAFPLYFKNVYRLNEDEIGLVMAMNGAGVAIVEMFLIHWMQNKWSHFKFISVGCLLLLCSLAVFVLHQAYFIIVISIVLITFSEMLAMPFMSTFAMTRAPKETMGQYSALYSMSWSLALILAPIVGTNIIDQFGFPSLWITLSILAFLTFVGFRWLGQQLQVKE